jgi:hypothetical protein
MQRRMLGSALALTLSLGACATTTGSVATDVSCEAFEPILWSQEDTDETIRQIREHNAVWVALCQSPDT